MKKSEADKRIEELEKRIKALEEQPKTIVIMQPVVIREVPVYPSWPIYPQITWTAGANTADVMCLS